MVYRFLGYSTTQKITQYKQILKHSFFCQTDGHIKTRHEEILLALFKAVKFLGKAWSVISISLWVYEGT